jgi:hypothetical protein
MARRKLNIPKAAQIRGIRKALANRKTPRQFIPGLKKRLAKLTACILFAFAAASVARAQAPVSIVPIQQTLAAAGTACMGSAQSFTANNRNQNQHTATLVLSGSTAVVSLQIQGVDSAGNTFIISPTAQGGALFNGVSAIVSASGYYPTINVLVTCTVGSTFTLSYVGTQASPVILAGTQLLSLIDQQIFTGLSGNQNSIVFNTPFGNSSGIVRFNYVTTPGAGGSIQVLCFTAIGGVSSQSLQFIFPLANSTATQVFKVPQSTCTQAQLIYTAGAASGNANEEYVFDLPGDAVNTTLGSYTHIVGTTATAVKATAGTLLNIVINTPAAGTISVFDLATAACTGTPSTNTVAVITVASATDAHATFSYNDALLNGICVKASAAMDITVSSQ